MLIIFCAPSGAGKTSIIKEIFKIFPSFRFSISATTRKKRNGEINGKDYYFITKKEFEQKRLNNEFVEWEDIYGEQYGTLKREVENSLTNKSDVIFDVDVKGALSIKNLYPETISVFIDAPKNEIIDRLKNRKTETDDDVKKRIERMELELNLKNKFDYVVMNKSKPGGFDNAIKEIRNIINKYKNK